MILLPGGLQQRLQEVEAKFRQFDTDIRRLWRRAPQAPYAFGTISDRVTTSTTVPTTTTTVPTTSTTDGTTTTCPSCSSTYFIWFCNGAGVYGSTAMDSCALSSLGCTSDPSAVAAAAAAHTLGAPCDPYSTDSIPISCVPSGSECGTTTLGTTTTTVPCANCVWAYGVGGEGAWTLSVNGCEGCGRTCEPPAYAPVGCNLISGCPAVTPCGTTTTTSVSTTTTVPSTTTTAPSTTTTSASTTTTAVSTTTTAASTTTTVASSTTTAASSTTTPAATTTTAAGTSTTGGCEGECRVVCTGSMWEMEVNCGIGFCTECSVALFVGTDCSGQTTGDFIPGECRVPF